MSLRDLAQVKTIGGCHCPYPSGKVVELRSQFFQLVSFVANTTNCTGSLSGVLSFASSAPALPFSKPPPDLLFRGSGHASVGPGARSAGWDFWMRVRDPRIRCGGGCDTWLRRWPHPIDRRFRIERCVVLPAASWFTAVDVVETELWFRGFQSDSFLKFSRDRSVDSSETSCFVRGLLRQPVWDPACWCTKALRGARLTQRSSVQSPRILAYACALCEANLNQLNQFCFLKFSLRDSSLPPSRPCGEIHQMVRFASHHDALMDSQMGHTTWRRSGQRVTNPPWTVRPVSVIPSLHLADQQDTLQVA